ncbi:MAG: TIGR02147 family protein [Pseudobdellovibrionaceae bacterium]
MMTDRHYIMHKTLNIFEFSDYRIYLSEWIEKARKQKTSNLSRIAEVAQVHPTFLSHVLAGAKALSLEQAALISEHIALTRLEQDYFFALIQLDRAGNQKLKTYWLKRKKEIEDDKNKLSQRFARQHRQLNSEEKVIFYSSWLYVAIWTATAISHGQTVKDIASRFQISMDRASTFLTFLTQTGLCNEKLGLYSIGDTHVHVPNESPFVGKHHTNWRIKAIQKMDTREPNELFFTGPMSIAKKDFEVLRENLNKLIEGVVETAQTSKAEDVFCLNIDLFKTQ